jgi:hypothetical protein
VIASLTASFCNLLKEEETVNHMVVQNLLVLEQQ